jgi:hypothetical protein
MACPEGDFQRLLPDAFQPRAYEFLLKRLTDKFSVLTKECDDELKSQFAEAIKEIKSRSKPPSKGKNKAGSAGAAVATFVSPAGAAPTIAQEIAEILELHGGKNTKDIRSQLKVRELDAFIDSFVSQLLGTGPDTIDLISSTGDVCFEGKEDDVSKFRELAPDQRRYWLDHLIEMIGFFKNLSMSQVNPTPALLELCRQNITKYSKLLFLLKKYLLPKPTQPGLEWLEASSEQLRDAIASLFQPPPEPQEPVAREPRPRRDRGRSPSPNRSRSRSPPRKPTIDELGGGSPKASITKTKPKTRNNRYSKNARTRKNKHKRKHPRNRKYKYKKTTNTKSNRRTKPQSKKNVTFKRRRR